jgi:hypothetical protein
MKIYLAKYVCRACKRSFEAPILGESSYGEFLLWTASGVVAYLNAIENTEYAEVEEILLRRFDFFKQDEFKSAEVLQNIFGVVACDPDENGFPFKIGARPRCPHCKEGHGESWDIENPTQLVQQTIPAAQHLKWARLSAIEKNQSVDWAVPEASSG